MKYKHGFIKVYGRRPSEGSGGREKVERERLVRCRVKVRDISSDVLLYSEVNMATILYQLLQNP